jgi:hypothetical protein
MVAVLAAGCSFAPSQPVDEDAYVEDGMTLDALVSDASPDARTCPPMIGCTAFQCATTSSCYYYCTPKTSWQNAQTACAGLPQGCLVTINDQSEQDCVVSNVMPTFANFPWIGFRQSASGAEPAGGWSFVCGTSSYVAPNWGSFEPNDIGGEDCAAMTDGGGWFDATCGDPGRYVCEVQ